jgi:hypothetical protein
MSCRVNIVRVFSDQKEDIENRLCSFIVDLIVNVELGSEMLEIVKRQSVEVDQCSYRFETSFINVDLLFLEELYHLPVVVVKVLVQVRTDVSRYFI